MMFSRVVPAAASLLVCVALAQPAIAQTSSGAQRVPVLQKPANLIPPPPPPPGGTNSSQATLLLQTDAPCSLSILGADDEIKNRDLPVGTTKVNVVAGETTLVCSPSEPAVEAFSKTITAAAGQSVLVNIQLAASIGAGRQAQQQRCNAEADRNDPDGRFRATAAGTLVDSQTGLQWTQTDNGKPINWKRASRYCAAMKGGWRLPTIDELSGLYSSCVAQKCFAAGGTQFSCHVSSRIRLTGMAYWSSQSQDPSMAFAVDFEGDKAQSGLGISSDADDGERALCVRHP